MEERYQQFQAALKNGLVDTLIGLQTRMADRDNTALLVVPYDNIGDWLEHNPMFLTGGMLYQSLDRYLAGILRCYVVAQIRGAFPYAPEDRIEVFQDLVNNIIQSNIATYKQTVETRHRQTWAIILKSFKPMTP